MNAVSGIDSPRSSLLGKQIEEETAEIQVHSPEITEKYVGEMAEKIENAVYNICVFLGRDCEEQAFKKFSNSLAEHVVNHHAETGLEKILELYSTPVSRVLLPGVTNLLANSIDEHLIDQPIAAEICDASSPFLRTISKILSVALRILFRPFVRHLGQISAQIYADRTITGKLSRLIKEKLLPHPANKNSAEHEKPNWTKEIHKVASLSHLEPLLKSLNELALEKFQIKDASEKKYKSWSLSIIYKIETGILKSVDNIDALVLWVPGEQKTVLDYLSEKDEEELDPLDLHPLC